MYVDHCQLTTAATTGTAAPTRTPTTSTSSATATSGRVRNIRLVVSVFGSSFRSRSNFVCRVSMIFSRRSLLCCRLNDVHRINGVHVSHAILVRFRSGSTLGAMFSVYILVIWRFFLCIRLQLQVRGLPMVYV